MSANNLRWYWIEPITDSNVIRELLIKNKESVTTATSELIVTAVSNLQNPTHALTTQRGA